MLLRCLGISHRRPALLTTMRKPPRRLLGIWPSCEARRRLQRKHLQLMMVVMAMARMHRSWNNVHTVQRRNASSTVEWPLLRSHALVPVRACTWLYGGCWHRPTLTRVCLLPQVRPVTVS